MPFLVLFIASWTAFLLFSDRTRWRTLLPASLLAMMMSLTSDLIVHEYPLWYYEDESRLLPNLAISLLDDFGVYPVTAYLFLQFYPAGRSLTRQIAYYLLWTTGVISLEKIFCANSWMHHNLWWNLLCSYLADWLIFYLLSRFFLALYPVVPAARFSPFTPPEHADPSFFTTPFVPGERIDEYCKVEVPSGGLVPLHSHPGNERFVLLQGEIEILLDATWHRLTPCDQLFIPASSIHGARNTGSETAVGLSMLSNAPSESTLLPSI